MALQVWLPLTGSIEQQGLEDVEATVNGTVSTADAGKVGRAIQFGTTAGYLTLPPAAMTSFTECTITFWVKLLTWQTNYCTLFQAGYGSSPWNNYVFGILRHNNTSHLCVPITNNSSSSTGATFVTSDLSLNTWYHIAVTYSATDKQLKIYLNGSLDKTYNTTTYIPDFAGITKITVGKCNDGSNYQSNCLMNDFRIYDNCLTDDEVKEIALGKIAHYHMDDNCWGGTNLWENGSCRENLTGMVQSSVPFTITEKDGYKCAHISGVKGSSNNTGHLRIPSTMTVQPDEWYTISADMKLENFSAGTSQPFVGLYFSGRTIDGTWYSVVNRTGTGDAADRLYPNAYNNTGWHRVYITGMYTKTIDNLNVAYVYARDFTGDLYVKNIQFQRGKCTSAPPYVPADGDTVFGSGLGPTGNNMLYDTNASSLTAENGPGARYYESSSGSGYTNTFVELTDPPLKEIRYGVRQTVTSVSGGHSVVWYANGGVPVVVGQPYTMSCYVQVVSGTNLKLIHEYGGFSSYESVQDTLISDGMWHQYSWTFTPTTSCASGNQTRIYPGGLYSVGEVLICGWKLEKGTKATPWQPHPTEMIKGGNRAIFDCSGFKHNMLLNANGAISYSTNTPKYLASQYFNGSTYLCTKSGSMKGFTFDKCTIMAWIKPDNVPSAWTGSIGISHDQGANLKTIAISNYGGKFTVATDTSNAWTITQSTSSMPAEEWHHCVATLDGTSLKMYFDGALVKTATISWGTNTVASDTRLIMGADLPGGDEYFTGNYSDVRFYATALSAEDISAIYSEGNPPESTRVLVTETVNKSVWADSETLDSATHTLANTPVAGTQITLNYTDYGDSTSNTLTFTVGTSQTKYPFNSDVLWIVYNGDKTFTINGQLDEPGAQDEEYVKVTTIKYYKVE